MLVNKEKVFTLVAMATLALFGLVFFQNFTYSTVSVSHEEMEKGRKVLIALKDWLVSPALHTRSKNTKIGMVSKETVLTFDDGRVATVSTDITSSKICFTLKYLTELGKSKSMNYDARADIKTFADRLLELQVQDPQSQLYGGFPVTETYQLFTASTNGTCGLALLDAAKYLSWGSPSRGVDSVYFKAAVRVANFLNKFKQPSLFSGLEDFVFVNNDGVKFKTANFWIDSINIQGKIQVTDRLNNSSIIEFLDNLESYNSPLVSPRKKSERENQIIHYYQGAIYGYDFYSPRFETLHTKKILGSNSLSTVHNDNRWHRRPEEADDEGSQSDETGKVIIGGDGTEEVIRVFEAIGEFERSQKIYSLYENVPIAFPNPKIKGQVISFSIEDQLTGNHKFDSYIGWGMYYLIGARENDRYLPSEKGNRYHMGIAYDFDPITYEAKARLNICRVNEAMKKLLRSNPMLNRDLEVVGLMEIQQSHWVYALLDYDLKPYSIKARQVGANWVNILTDLYPEKTFIETDKAVFNTRGSSTTANNGLMLLRWYEAAKSGKLAQCK